MDTLTKFSTPGIIFLLTVATGFWLSHSGKPLNTLIFTIHKLIALAAVILAARQFYLALRDGGSQAVLIALLVLAGLCVVALFATGALMSADPAGQKLAYSLLLNVHRIAPLLAVLALAMTVYFLAGRQL